MCVPIYNSQSYIILYLKLTNIPKLQFVNKEINQINNNETYNNKLRK